MTGAGTRDNGHAGPALDPGVGKLLEQALSHAIRTPLHSLLGFLELLAMGELDAEQRRLTDDLFSSSEDLLDASDRVAWLVRLLAGQHRAQWRPVQLAELVAEVAETAATRVVVHVAVDAPRQVEADVAALHQLLTELVTNAVRHGAAPITLTVTSAPATSPQGASNPAGVQIRISDAGRGMPRAATQQLLAPFDGADLFGDTVGLLLIRQLTRLLGGVLALPAVPAGCQVVVTLPARPTVPTGGISTAGDGDGAIPRLRVLLVEDNATNRLLTQRQVTRLGHQLTSVTTAADGVAAALAGDIDVVLMDRHLPDFDGVEAARRIHSATPPGHRIPIIAVTADATEETAAACLAAGMDQVLTKPVDLAQLGAALSRAGKRAVDRGRASLTTGTHHAEDGHITQARWAPPALRHTIAQVDGDLEAAAELLDTYLGELHGRRLRIQASLRRGERRAIVAATESLRAASDTVGATAVSGACAAIAAAADDPAMARAFLPNLLLQTQHFHNDLAPFCDAVTMRETLHPVTSSG